MTTTTAEKTCSFHACNERAERRGVCNKHYLRLRRTGHRHDEPKRHPIAALLEDVEFLLDCGEPITRITQATGYRHWESLEARLRHNGHPELADTIHQLGKADDNWWRGEQWRAGL
ncbi:hypothetical protein GCM10009785_00140 [Brooklawnia cerclae]|uniref:Uncharacterized protein n=1 Tax=Brooklawnia cerclae TaxID=349934 RepID=A0ABX0SKH9_9ACTN|nr:hypothetical protein [Brooklawnia cerclae]NIH58495.1 hypothetical protein [Brooklawnia cerclae]